MPFERFDIDEYIEERRKSDPDFKEAWDSSRTEYRIIGELTRIRKEKGLSQLDLAERTGHKQQVISRVEQRESSPTLKTFCALADELDVEILIIPRHIV